MQQQQKLTELYSSYFDQVQDLQSRYDGLSGPLLIHIPESYFRQKTRLMVVGQQTAGWERGSIDDLLQCYQGFNLGEKYKSTPFWNMIRKMETIFSIEPYAMIWSNLNRCDYKLKRPPRKIEMQMTFSSEMLLKEIEILKPDIVWFFTGPSFDEKLDHIFQGIQYQEITGFSIRAAAKLSHGKLPRKSFRSYHPMYLRLRRLESGMIDFINGIKS